MSELTDWVRLDANADAPLFDQLRTQIIDGIRDGRLTAGARLPTVRDLAARLGLAVNTVARTYRELEAAGMVETRRRLGTFVCGVDPGDTAMVAAARTFVDSARALGIEPDEAMRYVKTAFGRA
ncbi:MAG: GntR family transcriptional regulator [Mycobacteriaceae bacterium]|nr:GntR family transcriptional regulator [Mycobacteriaceae bacterium]MBV9515293.1 GntR family transcriptional regulator [Mycobacteriaceae bacterium]